MSTFMIPHALDLSEDEAGLSACERFILELGRALHRYGASSSRLEDALLAVSSQLDVKAQVLSTPTSMLLAFGESFPQRICLLRVDPGGVDLARLCALSEIAGQVSRAELNSAQGAAQIQAVLLQSDRWSGWMVMLATALASACAARFFGGALSEIVASSVLGALVGALGLYLPRTTATARLYEPLSAALVALLTALIGAIWPITVYLVMVSGLIALVPGFTLTLAIKELATRNLVSGAARSFSAMLVFLELGFGVFLGQRLATALPSAAPLAQHAGIGSLWSEGLALLLAPLAFGVLFQARRRDFWAILATGASAYLGARIGSALMGAEVGAFLGAIMIGCLANALGRSSDRPATALQIPGVIMLVPGSVGFKSITALMGQDALAGVQVGFTMLMIATAIVAGLLFADALVPTRRPL